MPNQKGSLKDRIRSWQMFLRYKKEQRKKLKELKKKQKKEIKEKQLLLTGKYYSKPKIFGLTILGLFLGLFEPKNKDKKMNIEEEIINLELKLNKKTIDIEDVKKLEQIDKKLVKEKYIHLGKNDKEIDNYIKRVEVLKESIKKEAIVETIKANTLKKEKKQTLNEDITKKDNEIESNTEIKISKKTYVPILEVKQLNKDLDKYNKKIKDINSKIDKTEEYNSLFDYEFEIKQLKLKIEEIVIRYELLKKLPGFKELENYIKIKEIDFYEIRKSDKKIKDKISLCNETLVQIEERKKEIIINQKKTTTLSDQPSKQNQMKTEIKEKSKEVKKEDNNKLFEITLANKIIYDSLIKEQRRVAKLERSLSKMTIKKKRPSVFYYTKNLVSSVLNFTFGLFPISLFQNKMLGGLVSGMMINNSLRSVRKILNPDVQITYIYENLEQEILTTSNFLNRMDFLISDSLNQVKAIRQSILNKYGFDIEYQKSLVSYLEELDKVQTKLEFEQEKILGLNQDLNKVYKKNKQKVLTIEKQNNYNSQ